MSAPPRARFSHASIHLAAAELQTTASPSVEEVLQKLMLIDAQIDHDFKTLKDDLAKAQAELARARAERARESAQCAVLQQLTARQEGVIEQLKFDVKLLREGAGVGERGEEGKERGAGRDVREGTGTGTGTGAGAEMGVGVKVRVGGKKSADSGGKEEGEKGDALAAMSSKNLYDLLSAREKAYANQQTLVQRLKRDNTELKATYDKLWERYQVMYTRGPKGAPKVEVAVDEKIEHLSFRVQQAGQAARNVASQVEERLQMTAKDVHTFRSTWRQVPPSLEGYEERERTEVDGPLSLSSDGTGKDMTGTEVYGPEDVRLENERFNMAGAELIRTLALQQEAHDRLRSTVVELTKELERISPEKINEIGKYQTELGTAQQSLETANGELEKKTAEIAHLEKQLKKVVAEYEAVSIAHSYSNAELSKIRANNRAKTKHDRQINDRPGHHGKGHGVLDGVENLLHHRKNHFR